MDAIDSRTQPRIPTTPPPDAEHATRREGAATPGRPTPRQFYQRVARRPDVREILARLAR